MEEKRIKKLASANRNKSHDSKAQLHPGEHLRKKKFNPEIEALFARAQYLRKDLEAKIKEFYSKTGLKESDIDNFLADPNNFSPSEWAFVKNYVELLHSQFSSQTGLRIPQKKVAMAPEQEGLSKTRKTKFLGSRKKWIPMK